MKSFKMLQDTPLHIRKRIAVITTGIIALGLIAVLVLLYNTPSYVQRDPARAVAAAYTTILTKVQSLFHRK